MRCSWFSALYYIVPAVNKYEKYESCLSSADEFSIERATNAKQALMDVYYCMTSASIDGLVQDCGKTSALAMELL